MQRTTQLASRASDWQPPRARALCYVNGWTPVVHVLPAPASVGRSPRCDISLADAALSRRHAELAAGLDSDELLLTDLSSRNGTFVDGRRVTTATVRSGSVIRMGNSVVVVEVDRFSDPALRHPGSFHSWGLPARVEQLRTSGQHLLVEGESGAGKMRLCEQLLGPRELAVSVVDCSPKFGGEFGDLVLQRTALLRSQGIERPVIVLSRLDQLAATAQQSLLSVVDSMARASSEPTPDQTPVRFVALSSGALADLVRSRRFSSPLYHRLAQTTVTLPPLRERRMDIMEALASELADLSPSPDLVESLLLHSWSGNHHELQTITHRLRESAPPAGSVDMLHLPPELRLVQGRVGLSLDQTPAPPDMSTARPPAPARTTLRLSPDRPAQETLEQWLLECHGNVSELARVSGKHRNQIVRWLKAYNLPTGHIAFEEWLQQRNRQSR